VPDERGSASERNEGLGPSAERGFHERNTGGREYRRRPENECAKQIASSESLQGWPALPPSLAGDALAEHIMIELKDDFSRAVHGD
jgi:hypothetical protein